MRNRKDRSYDVKIIRGDVKLCPGCKLRYLEDLLPKRRSYTRQPRLLTTHRLCQDLRTEARVRKLDPCTYYKGMDLTRFLARRKRK